MKILDVKKIVEVDNVNQILELAQTELDTCVTDIQQRVFFDIDFLHFIISATIHKDDEDGQKWLTEVWLQTFFRNSECTVICEGEELINNIENLTWE